MTFQDLFNVKEFMDACNQDSSEKTADLYADLINEELNELIRGIQKGDRIETLDGICDTIWVLAGFGYALGFDVQGAFEEVTRSNFSKCVQGKVIKDKNGKVQKPDTYFKPDLTKFI